MGIILNAIFDLNNKEVFLGVLLKNTSILDISVILSLVYNALKNRAEFYDIGGGFLSCL